METFSLNILEALHPVGMMGYLLLRIIFPCKAFEALQNLIFSNQHSSFFWAKIRLPASDMRVVSVRDLQAAIRP